MILIFLSSGLFLGWSLGANDAANVFGTAVGTRMIKFARAAIICSVFCILGAVIGGAGAARTLGRLGAVSALGGAFMVALSAGVTIFTMTRCSLPVSTSQAIVGAIICWNLFTGSLTDTDSLTAIVGTWVVCPVLSAGVAVLLFSLIRMILRASPLHLFREDTYTRWGLILVGAFGAYSLGANNIANVMGVFVPVAPFAPIRVGGLFTLSGAQQLFLVGGLAIALGVYTYSRRVMQTVGRSLFRLSPQTALVVVLAHSIVLFLFSSQELESFLVRHGLPTIPLVPVSSSQAVVGAVLGIGMLRGWRNIRFRVLGEIAAGWVTTPVLAGALAFVALFFLQNVFQVPVKRPVSYQIVPAVTARLAEDGVADPGLVGLDGLVYDRAYDIDEALKAGTGLDREDRRRVIRAAERGPWRVDASMVEDLRVAGWIDDAQATALGRLEGREFIYRWQLVAALEELTPAWRLAGGSGARLRDRDLLRSRDYLFRVFRSTPDPSLRSPVR